MKRLTWFIIGFIACLLVMYSFIGAKMDDCISRRAAIDALDKQFWTPLNIPICKEIRNVAKETIKALPSAF